MHDNHARYAGNKECAKRGSPARPLHNDRCWQRKGDARVNPLNIFLQIANVVKARRRLELEKQPADVRLE